MRRWVYRAQYQALCASLVAARTEAGLTQEQLARRLQKPQSFVSKYERGERRLDVVEFVAVARAIGVDPCDIIKKIAKA